MKNEQLTAEQLNYLRSSTLLREDEFAYKAGDLIIAENPVSGEKRIIGPLGSLNEYGIKRVLKG